MKAITSTSNATPAAKADTHVTLGPHDSDHTRLTDPGCGASQKEVAASGLLYQKSLLNEKD